MFQESSDEYGPGIMVDRYNINIKGDCFTWEDGKTGRSSLVGGRRLPLWEHVYVTLNVPPHTMMGVCFDSECSDQSEGGDLENRTDKTIQHTFSSHQDPWTDTGNMMPNFWIEVFRFTEEAYRANKA